MATRRETKTLREIHCTHTCVDKQHTLRWSEGDSISLALYLDNGMATRYGPYCHYCGEYLEEEK